MAALQLEYSVANFLMRSSGGGGIELALDLVVVEESSALGVWIGVGVSGRLDGAVGAVLFGAVSVGAANAVGAGRSLVGRLSAIAGGGVG